jgi:hypothetical protein
MKSKFGIILLAILAVSSLALCAGAFANPFMSSTTVPNVSSTGATAVGLQRDSVRMYGAMQSWLTTPTPTPITGAIEVLARTQVGPKNTIQGYAAAAIWTTNLTHPIATPVKSRENFTYTYDTARLVEGNFSALDFNGNAFYLNGTWNVWSITENFTIVTDSTGHVISIDRNQNAVRLAIDAYGNVTVPAGWTTFTLDIKGVAPLTGKVVAEVTISSVFNPFMLGMDSSTTTVTKADLDSIVNAYGSMPGWGNYNINMDFCMHNQIDICDLSTAAANLNA